MILRIPSVAITAYNCYWFSWPDRNWPVITSSLTITFITIRFSWLESIIWCPMCSYNVTRILTFYYIDYVVHSNRFKFLLFGNRVWPLYLLKVFKDFVLGPSDLIWTCNTYVTTCLTKALFDITIFYPLFFIPACLILLKYRQTDTFWKQIISQVIILFVQHIFYTEHFGENLTVFNVYLWIVFLRGYHLK